MGEGDLYTEDEVREILRRAVERDADRRGDLSHEDLRAAAAEIGIDPAAVDAAAAEVSLEREIGAEITRARDAKVSSFRRHLFVYVVVNALLAAIDLLGGGATWFFWPLLGWGAFVALQAGRLVGRDHAAERKAAKKRVKKRRASERRRRRRQDERRARRERSEARRRAGEEFEQAVEAGVEALLGAVTRKVESAARRLEDDPPPPDTEFGRYVAREKGLARPDPVKVRAPEQAPEVGVRVAEDEPLDEERAAARRPGERKSRA